MVPQYTANFSHSQYHDVEGLTFEIDFRKRMILEILQNRIPKIDEGVTLYTIVHITAVILLYIFFVILQCYVPLSMLALLYVNILLQSRRIV